MNNLAGLYEKKGRYEEVESLYKRALEILTKAFGKEHPNTQTCLKSLLTFYESQNQTDAVQELKRKIEE
jgi:tetratricopeptide (TPR) repeat protein